MGVLTYVTCSFSADHLRPYGDARHGHDWHVMASYHTGLHKTESEEFLSATCAKLDHKFLDDIIADPTNEGVAAWIGEKTGAQYVRVWRFDKGREFGAEWRP